MKQEFETESLQELSDYLDGDDKKEFNLIVESDDEYRSLNPFQKLHVLIFGIKFHSGLVTPYIISLLFIFFMIFITGNN